MSIEDSFQEHQVYTFQSFFVLQFHIIPHFSISQDAIDGRLVSPQKSKLST
jgi:hypothetical protein